MKAETKVWLRFNKALIENDYVLSLAGCMSCSQVEAAGYVALVVAFGLSFADDNGTIDHLTDHSIERACYWDGEPGELIRLFTESGIFVGERDSDTNPLAISPDVWHGLGGEVLAGREAARKRKAEQRARDRAGKKN